MGTRVILGVTMFVGKRAFPAGTVVTMVWRSKKTGLATLVTDDGTIFLSGSVGTVHKIVTGEQDVTDASRE